MAEEGIGGGVIIFYNKPRSSPPDLRWRVVWCAGALLAGVPLDTPIGFVHGGHVGSV